MIRKTIAPNFQQQDNRLYSACCCQVLRIGSLLSRTQQRQHTSSPCGGEFHLDADRGHKICATVNKGNPCTIASNRLVSTNFGAFTSGFFNRLVAALSSASLQICAATLISKILSPYQRHTPPLCRFVHASTPYPLRVKSENSPTFLCRPSTMERASCCQPLRLSRRWPCAQFTRVV